MIYTVLWAQEALDELARLWIEADSALRKAITSASHQIERTLAEDPENTGESRVGLERIWFVFPLGIRFEIDRAKMTVRLLQLWGYRKRK